MSHFHTGDEEQMQKVSAAFSMQSAKFDELEEENQILQWMRSRIRRHVIRLIPPESNMLELNAGTGMDAVFFAKLGHRVLATDNADGMLEVLKVKVVQQNLQEKIIVQKCSYTDLSKIEHGPFDCIFSNFGGLNCVSDPEQVIKQFPSLLKPGGVAILVIMPPVCPWEMMLAVKGNFKTAFRRLHKKGVMANVEGIEFRTYYFTPSTIMKAAGSNFKKLRLAGLGSVAPPPYLDRFPQRFPQLFKKLKRWDEKIERNWPFNSMNDHFIISMKLLQDRPATGTMV